MPADSQPTMRKFGDHAATRQGIYDGAFQAVSTLPPAQNSRYSLGISDVGWSGPETPTLADHKRALVEGRSLTRRLTGTVTLTDKATNAPVDSRRMTIAAVPVLTNQGVFVHEGSANVVSHQMRLLPGVYARRKGSGTVELHTNLLPGTGVPHRVELDPATGVFKTLVGQAEIPTITLLKALGATPEELRQAWGDELYAKNSKADRPHHIEKYWERMGPPGVAPDGTDKAAVLAQRVSQYPLDPWVSKRTLGKPYDKYGKEPLLVGTAKLLKIARGEQEPDDRDNPAFSTVWGPEHLLAERLSRSGPLMAKILWQATNTGNLKRVQPGFLSPAVRALFTKSGLAMNPEGTSAAEFMDHGSRITKIGEGGIGKSAESVPAGARSVHPAQFPFIDSVRTSESETVGVDLRVAFGTRLGADRKLYAPLRDAKTNRLVFRSIQDVDGKTLAFPGAMHSDMPVVPVIKNGKITYAPKGEVDYVVPSMEQSFSPMTGLVPLKSASKPHRSSMGARMITQSLPLLNAEAPLVRTQVPGQPGRSFEEMFGRHMGAVFAKNQPGQVVGVEPDAITVRYADGTTEKHERYHLLPAGRKSGLTTEPLVKPGDPVAPGQILAKSNYTDEKGHAAYGLNLRTGFLNMKGSVTPDTYVLWYDAAGRPRYTPISAVTTAATRALSLDTARLDVGPSSLVKCWTHPADANVVRIRTDSGRQVRATTNHSFVTLTPTLELIDVPGGALVAGESWLPRVNRVDLPVTVTRVTLPATQRLPELTVAADADLGFICGLYAAEGCVGGDGKRAVFAVGDPVLREALVACVGRVFPHISHTVRVNHVVTRSGSAGVSTVVDFFDTRLGRWLDDQCGHLAANKKVPDFVFGSSIEARRAFISGYWAGDGRVHARPDGRPKDTDTLTTSRVLRDGLGLLLASVGVSTTHGEYTDARYTHGVVYRLGVSTRDTRLMPAFPHTDKWTRLQQLAASYRGDATGKGTGTADMIPCPPSVRKLLRDRARVYFGTKSKEYKRFNVAPERAVVARRDVFLLVKADDSSEVLQRLRTLAASPIEWDLVQTITPDDYAGPVYDLDMGERRTFVCVDTLVVHNSTYEDSIVLSRSAADRMTSDHLYHHYLPHADDVMIGKAAHAAAFPGKHPLEKLKNFDDDGVIKVGTRVEEGDPLILAVRKKQGVFGRLSRSGKASLTDASDTWEYGEPGEVSDVYRTKNGPVVLVRSFKKMEVGDKLSGRHGNKGVVVIRPDDEMPVDKDGKPLEMVISSLGTISRANPSAIYEAILGKIAAKTGRPYVVNDWDDEGKQMDVGKFVHGELARHGMTAKEDLVDPQTGRTIPNVLTGQVYTMKLHHMSAGKVKGRGLGGYDESGQPLRGQSGKAMRASLGDTNALLSHGATDVIADAHNFRGQANEDFWLSFMSGYPPTRPAVSKPFERFLTELRAAGVDPVRRDGRYHLMALTDSRVKELAGDREVKNGETLDFSRNGEPVPGGLFDSRIFGTTDNQSTFAKISLHEPVLNPAMEEPARRLLGLTERQFRDVIAGRHELHGGTGMRAVYKTLAGLDVGKELARTRLQAQGARKTAREEANRRLFYLKGLEKTGQTPKDWFLSAVPVLPPAFRPVSAGSLGGKSSVVVHDANYLYADLLNANHALRDLSKEVDDVGDERLNLYDAVKAVVGLGDPVGAKNKEKGVKGVLGRLLGDTSKMSFLQQKLLGTPVNLSGRGQVIPNPDLDLDQAGIPESMAKDVYHPFVVRRLVRGGMGRVDAAREVEAWGPRAKQALLDEMAARPVLMTRYPALHRYNVMAFHPVLVPGDAIHTNHLINKGYNLDHDGDTMTVNVPLSDDAVKEAYEKLLPSRNLFGPANFKTGLFNPNMEQVAGLHAASTADEGNPPVEFATRKEAVKAYLEGKINVGTRVRIHDES